MAVQVNSPITSGVLLENLSFFCSMMLSAYETYDDSLIKKDIWKNIEKKRIILEFSHVFNKDQIKKLTEWEHRAKRMYYDLEETTIGKIRKIADKLNNIEQKELEKYILTNCVFKDAIKKKNILFNDSEDIKRARFIYMIYMMRVGKAISFRSHERDRK